MNLVEWFKLDPSNVGKLSASLERSEATVKAYAYGYRRIPKKALSVIVAQCNGCVTEQELLAQHEQYCNGSARYELVLSKGNRTGKPILQVAVSDTLSAKTEFVNTVLKLVS